jgi:hypothetical protein
MEEDEKEIKKEKVRKTIKNKNTKRKYLIFIR